MDRVIKWRSWHLGLKEMKYDNYINQLKIHYFESVVVVMMQYIEVKDKNGIEIYHNDILKCKDNDGNYVTGTVVMSKFGCWSIKVGHIKIPILNFIDNQLSLISDYSRIEIVGNIYETPEKLKYKNSCIHS